MLIQSSTLFGKFDSETSFFFEFKFNFFSFFFQYFIELGTVVQLSCLLNGTALESFATTAKLADFFVQSLRFKDFCRFI